MMPRKRVVLCGRSEEEISLLAFVLTNRLRVSASRYTSVRLALKAADREGADLLIYVHASRKTSDMIAAKNDLACLGADCEISPLVVWDQTGTLQANVGIILKGMRPMDAFLELMRVLMVKKRGPVPRAINSRVQQATA